MEEYIQTLEKEFLKHSNLDIAIQQKAYMRGQFEYFGLKAPIRREIQKPFTIKAYLPSKSEAFDIVKRLWLKDEREFQMFAIDLLDKYKKQFEIDDIQLLEKLVIEKSWWDTVDFISYKLMGEYFKKYPQNILKYNNKWLESGNIWLQRSSLLFQLKYKEKMDLELLEHNINYLLGSKEFFINKAIGWVLREYSRTDAEWVVGFVKRTELAPLSRKEAFRLITK